MTRISSLAGASELHDLVQPGPRPASKSAPKVGVAVGLVAAEWAERAAVAAPGAKRRSGPARASARRQQQIPGLTVAIHHSTGLAVKAAETIRLTV